MDHSAILILCIYELDHFTSHIPGDFLSETSIYDTLWDLG